MGLAIAAAVVAAGASAGGAYLSSRKKTDIPEWNPMDIGGEAAKALASNETNFAGSAALTSKANAYNQDEVLKMLRRIIPGFDEIMSKASKEYSSGIEGKLSESAVHQIRQEAATYGQKSGTYGSQFSNLRELRNYGLNVEAKINNSLNSFQSWTRNMASMFQPGMTSIASSFISPEAWIKQKQSDKENAWRVSMGQAIEDSRPSAGATAAASGLGTLGSVAGMYAGYEFGQKWGTPSLTESDMTPVTRDWGNPFSAPGAAWRT